MPMVIESEKKMVVEACSSVGWDMSLEFPKACICVLFLLMG